MTSTKTRRHRRALSARADETLSQMRRTIVASATTFGDLPLSDRDVTWDGATAEGNVRKWASSDSSGDPGTIDWEKYRQAFFWYDEATAEMFGSYKLGFADVGDNGLEAIWSGVTAAATALSGGRGGVDIPAADRPKVESHVTRYYEKAAKQYEDPTIQAPFSTDTSEEAMSEQTPAPTPLADKNPVAAPMDTAQVTSDPSMKWAAVLAVEETPTVDDRILHSGCLSWRNLPLTLMGLIETSEGHDGAQVAGRIDTIERQGSDIVATGIFDDSDFGREVARMVAENIVNGVSVDLALTEVQWETQDGTVVPLDEDDIWDAEDLVMGVTGAVILGATVCPMQALDDAKIAIAASGAVNWRASVSTPFRVKPSQESGTPNSDVRHEVVISDERVTTAVNALLAAKLPERMAACKEGIDSGIMSRNEAREILGLAPVRGGDRILDRAPEGVDPNTHAAMSALSTIAETLASERLDDRVLNELREAVSRAPQIVHVEAQQQGPDPAALVAAALSDIGTHFADSNTALAEALSALAERPAPNVTIASGSRNVDILRDPDGRSIGYREVE